MNRVVAQFGSALDWGSRGRRFKSCQPDQLTQAGQKRLLLIRFFLCIGNCYLSDSPFTD